MNRTVVGQVFLKKSGRIDALSGHVWIYRSQIEKIKGDLEPGDLAHVFLSTGKCVGTGYWNEKSEITVRLLSNKQESGFGADFFAEKILKAVQFRQRFVSDTNAFRVISSEADGLPGLIVDQYAEVLVMQLGTFGMERFREQILEALKRTIPSRGIYEKSDSGSRRTEGLQEKTGWVEQSCGDEITIFEGAAKYQLNFSEGHKTGFYLDQRENRVLLAELVEKAGFAGGSALDVFCYQGGFALHLALKGMTVLGIDSQENVLQQAEQNRSFNGISEEKLRFKAANAFDELKSLETEGKKFDVVVLDPPSFVKRKAALEEAITGYKEILLRGFKLLNPGGLLAVFPALITSMKIS